MFTHQHPAELLELPRRHLRYERFGVVIDERDEARFRIYTEPHGDVGEPARPARAQRYAVEYALRGGLGGITSVRAGYSGTGLAPVKAGAGGGAVQDTIGSLRAA